MKKKLVLVGLSLVFSITAALQANNRFATARWTDSAAPGICQSPTTRPNDCTLTLPGTLCTTVVGTHTYTFYQFNSCVTAWYRPF